MALCSCGNEFPDERLRLGFRVCLECGEFTAQQEKARKARCTAPLYNKGPHGYIATRDQARDAGKK